MTSKKITQKGSITIPKDFRAETGLFPGSAVDIEIFEDRKGFYVTPHVPMCMFCGSVENVTSLKMSNFIEEKEICCECAKKIAKECLNNDNNSED